MKIWEGTYNDAFNRTVIFAAQLLAYLVKGLIGFGNPLISAPILSMGLDNVVITPGTLLLDCPVNAWITWKNRHSFQWRKICRCWRPTSAA